jgi:hypothetical protein
VDIQKNTQEIIRVHQTDYKGHDLVDIRVYYQDGNDWKPTKKGITFKRELLDDVLKALTQLSESITEKSVK